MSTMIERWSPVVILVALLLGMFLAAVSSDGQAPHTDAGSVGVADGEPRATVLTPEEVAGLVGGTAFGSEAVAVTLGVEPVAQDTPQVVASR